MSTANELCKLTDATGIDRVGGKALHLGELLRSGFPVPGGFVITTAAYRTGWTKKLSQSIVMAWNEMGAPRVAVRSSATAEDLDGASMAGQYDTYLNIDTESGLLDAVQKCWGSIDTERTRSYLASVNLTPDQVAMAVVVQRQIAADVSGVLFTADPQQAGAEEMVIEASWGLGESVVSGIVQPDLYRIDSKSGVLKSLTVSDKLRWIPAGHGEVEQDVPEAQRKIACLKTANLKALWHLGELAEKHYNAPQDIEWAISGGNLFMLQTRAITTLIPQQKRAAVLEEVKNRLAGQEGPWVRHNMGETLPHPHPLTWSLMHRFMSGAGGFGSMYRAVGFEPSPAIETTGFLELIAGEIYMDCTRAPEMFFEDYPFAYDTDLLITNPGAGQNPPTLPIGSPNDRCRVNKKLLRVGAAIENLTESLSDELNMQTVPEFERWYAQEKRRSLADLDSAGLIECWQAREERVFQQTAPAIFLPSLVEGHLQQALRTKLQEICWDRDPDELLQLLSVSNYPDATMRSNMHLELVARGKRSLSSWLECYGHRCPGEFDIAVPRWRERPADVQKLANLLKKGGDTHQLHGNRLEESQVEFDRLCALCPANELADFKKLVADFKRYLPFREDGKDAMILGCDLMRDVALAMGHRLGIGDQVFWLKKDELFDALKTSYVPEDILTERAARYAAESAIRTPLVVLANELDRLGEPSIEELPVGDRLPALTVSRGRAHGTVCIVHSPEDTGELCDEYILVCPSTDPSWTPLFVHAVAVVLERGGALSHGAVVAREMGVPAVVLPNATRLLKNGERISIDGERGAVIRISEETVSIADHILGPEEVHFPPEMIPPIAGNRERKAALLALWVASIWGIFLGLLFLLPPSVLHDPVLLMMDRLLWPLVNGLGRPGALATIAVVMSTLLMGLQRIMTDNARMLACRDRAALLREQTKQFEPDAPRKLAAEALAKPVTKRMLIAAMVPIAVLLGPLCILFTWLPLRFVPTAQNAPAGSSVTLVATIDGEWVQPIHLTLDDRLALEVGKAEQRVPPIRATLENLRREWKANNAISDYHWAVQAAALKTRDAMLTDLDDYLRYGVPAQSLVWTIRAPDKEEGNFTFSVSTADQTPINGVMRLGDSIPAVAAFDLIETDSVVQKIEVIYPPNPKKAVFWAPLARYGWPVDFGWLWTYLLAYLPPMLALKKWLNVA